MLHRIQQLLSEAGITLSAPLPLSECTVTRPYLLTQKEIPLSGSAVIFAIPYHSPACENTERNLSRYAVGKDYHLFVKQLADQILPTLLTEFPTAHFALFADHSPIDEREAAAKCGLGVIGKHGLLITKPYSSYVFLGELVTDIPLPSDIHATHAIELCEGCGACLSACPYAGGEFSECLSALTQKKGTLSAEEEHALKQYQTVWGCDICQEVCPHTKAALRNGTLSSPIPFFNSKPIPHVTYNGICEMSDREFSERAYAWRGRQVILRNLAAVEEKNEERENTEHSH